MTAYVLAEIDVTDPQGFEDYRRQVPATLVRYGGRFVVRGGHTETLEGTWTPKRVVVLEFPDRAQRQKSALTQLIVVDGV